MFCKNCRTQLDDSAKFCNNCGATIEAQTASQPQPQPQQTYTAQPVYNTQYESLASSSMTMGILSIVLGGIFGLIFGLIAKSKAKQYVIVTGNLDGKAKAGMIMGTIGLILGIIFCVFFALIGILSILMVLLETVFYY